MKWLLLIALALATGARAEPFAFALVGDLPYTRDEESQFAEMLARIGREKLAFVIHVGDFKSGGSVCSDQLFEERRRLLQESVHPLVLVPGDNDWTDCHRLVDGGYDPQERLARLRELFFAGRESLGQHRLLLERQSERDPAHPYPEHVRWARSGVLFVGINVVGSNNNFGPGPRGSAEFEARSRAVRAWLGDSFRQARREGHSAVVVAMHADPLFDAPPGAMQRTGYNEFIEFLREQVAGFDKPVLLVHGDGHRFRLDRPLRDGQGRALPNFLRLESFGSPHVSWVRVTVDAARPEVFQFDPRL